MGRGREWKVKWERRDNEKKRPTFPRKRLNELNPPLGLCAVHLEHRHAHDEDDNRGDELEDACYCYSIVTINQSQ